MTPYDQFWLEFPKFKFLVRTRRSTAKHLCLPGIFEYWIHVSEWPNTRLSSLRSSRGAKDEDFHLDFPNALRGKKILLATESWGPVNGVSRTTRSLVEYLRDNGVDLILVAPSFKGQSSEQKTWERRLPGCALPYNPDLTVVYPFHLDTLFSQSFQPDVIYLASPASLGFQMLLQIRQLRSPPPVLLNFQTDLSGYAEIMLPTPLDKFGVWLLATVQGFLFRTRAVHTIFYPCSAIRKYLMHVCVPVDRLVQLGRGVDTILFSPTQRDESYRRHIAPHGEIILICVCRIAPEKGFEFLAQVVQRLAADRLPFKLLAVGGNRNLAIEIKVQRLFDGVREHVVFAGFLTGSALSRAYASADLFLHCSITETFGLVVLEAMASGVPVIARDQGGPSDIIRHGQTGYLVPSRDLKCFVHLVKEVSLDPIRRAKLAAAAHQYADDTTWEKINCRAAWQMAGVLSSTDEESQGARRVIRPGVIGRVFEQLHLLLTVGIVYFMWLISVVPLVAHGNCFLPRARQAVQGQFQGTRPLRN
ncbi:Glycosyl transferase, family 1 [Penicillium expansum]|uniref:Glycosyl transferase, family 1 n=1 Tax=Penicillium expansum TaxID=27334 RepID=A0A0A2K908_PENEN|nr:Glycosyl transferase, family 1 [Penicillium expansum]KGO59631.1 Glycosyl transferase, family 1 [Penicillium expansum]KGO63361.1 Glycosyl transferase, family 1 [Penicillium expansum]